MAEFTDNQKNVINYSGRNLLVSASAGTGKTTVMIERIATLISRGADVSDFAVMTFTNLAAAEMKSRLAAKLAEIRNVSGMAEQLEKLDTASISTIHSFCAELLRSRFYAVDIDPSFSILDSVTTNTLRDNALDEIFREYFAQNDAIFKKVYKIFNRNRSEETFKEMLNDLYDFTRCLEDFPSWYDENRRKFVNFDENNPIVTAILEDICANLRNFSEETEQIAQKCDETGGAKYAAICRGNVEKMKKIDTSSLETALNGIYTLQIDVLGADKNYTAAEKPEIQKQFSDCRDNINKFVGKYQKLSRGKSLAELWTEMGESVLLTDKLKEILMKFDEKFFLAKKQRGGLDFNDLEHLTLQLLKDDETLSAIREKYKYVFVDEYQDTNPVQEAIISRLAGPTCKMFMVGDIKQSIYGFRGCDPTIFLGKFRRYEEDAKNPESGNYVEKLNKNFRSNREILAFVNDVFDCLMTEDFGKVDYRETSQLEGDFEPVLKTPSVQIDIVHTERAASAPEATEPYDITKPQIPVEKVSQGDVIAQKISRFVGMKYKDKNGEIRTISYGDIVILMRSMKAGTEIYDALVKNNIPVAANLKTESFANKEVRDIINLLRMLDNPYNDIYTVGACLSPLGGFSENELAQIKIHSDALRIPFYRRMKVFAEDCPENEISAKIKNFVDFTEQLRFYSHAATVDEVVLKILKETDYQLYVQGFPNGALRLRKLFAFVDSLKNAVFAQSVDKFLYYLDRSEQESEENISDANAVRMMTMHASKGLEFPVVIIADCQHRFNFDRDEVAHSSDFGMAMKHYDFQTMQVSETLATCACNMYIAKNIREEEMRLLYVAMTRAKFVLNIVGTASSKDIAKPKAPSAAICHMDWLIFALWQKYGNFVQMQTSEQIKIIDDKPEVEFSAQNPMCAQYETEAEKTAALQKLQFRYPFADQAKMPSKVVSSALDKEFISDETDFSAVWNQNNDRNAVGTAYHKVLQYVDYDASESEIAKTICGLVNGGKIPAEFAEKLDICLIKNVLNNPKLRALMSRGKVFHEMPFMLVAPYDSVAKDQRFSDDVMLQGVIDLLILGENAATVVDFKFSTHKAELLKRDYRYQLTSYRLAVEKICGVKKVESYILSIEDNVLIKV